ncbi:ribosome assembly factor SBDS [Candidatus Micrarchaeota archaeon]|nr:ribosome assembly factor SBDS [Candidatus Micrarchaeota archaeon]MBU1939470.1 ribosome assembly factor SBDS [Candidatus Micrarchaeota archaeon]
MVKMEDAVIARFEHAGEKFEILVDPDLAMDMKNGKEIAFDDLLAIDTVFKDANKGDVKGDDSVKSAFGTANMAEIATKIIMEGEVQLTTQQRRAIAERKRKDVIEFIVRNGINPQTNSPHPPQRIENAMEEAKITIDLHRPVREQIPIVLKELKKLLPISLEKLEIAVKIPGEFAGKGSGIVRKYDIKKEEWQNDGSLVVLLEVPAGVKNDLFNELNTLTHGAVETKIVEK